MAKDYWKSREEKWIKQNLRDDAQLMKEIVDHYEKAIEQISNDARKLLVNYAQRDGVDMAEAIKKVSQFDVKAFEKRAAELVKAKDFSDEANERLRAYNATMRLNRLEMLKAELGLALTEMDDGVQRSVNTRLTTAYRDEVKRQAGILGDKKLDDIARRVDQIVNASFQGAAWSQRLWVAQDELKGQLDGIISRSLIQGLNPKTMANNLIPLISDTIHKRRYVAERIAITETARVQDVAQMDSFKKSGYDYCRWIAEPTACEQCQDIANANDGVYLLTEVPGIPVHPACRCSKSAYKPRFDEPDKP